jgi:hypothetical protein
VCRGCNNNLELLDDSLQSMDLNTRARVQEASLKVVFESVPSQQAYRVADFLDNNLEAADALAAIIIKALKLTSLPKISVMRVSASPTPFFLPGPFSDDSSVSQVGLSNEWS